MHGQQCLTSGQAPAGRAAAGRRALPPSPHRVAAQAPVAQLDRCSLRQVQRLRGAAAAGAGSCLDQAVTRPPARYARSAPIALAAAGTSAAAGAAAAPTAASAAASALAGSAAPRLSPPDTSGGRRSPAKLAVFVSGGGSNLMALHAATLDGRINGSIVVRRGPCSPQIDEVVSGVDGTVLGHNEHGV